MSVIISLRDVYKAYYMDRKLSDARLVLEGVSLDIEEGEFVSLIGPSGCGKTTVLNLIAGFEHPTMGKVLFKGKEIEKPSPERGVVFQEYSLMPWMNVYKNVELALESNNVPIKDRPQIIQQALSKVGLMDYQDYRPNTLSGGMKQRVAIARLLAMDSEVFLMDEPFSSLDEQTRNRLDADLFELWKDKGKTVVFVTHNVDEAIIVSSRIVLFSDTPGKIIGEWAVSDDVRCPGSEGHNRMKNEILGLMPRSLDSL